MASKNDITGDSICTKPSRNSAYADNYERIFRNSCCAYCEDRLMDGEGVPYKGKKYHMECLDVVKGE